MAFAFGAGDLTRGGVNTQLLVLPGVGLVMVWTIRPIGKNEVSEGLEIQFTASATYTLVTCELSDVD